MLFRSIYLPNYEVHSFFPSFLLFLPFFIPTILPSPPLYSPVRSLYAFLSSPVLSSSFVLSYFCLFFPLRSFLSAHVLSYSFVSSLNSPKFQFDSLSYQSKQSSQPPEIDRATSRGSDTVVEKSLRNINPITCA